jgi:regulator of nucleoside diphosphate kinase
MKNEPLVTSYDYSMLNSMILELLDSSRTDIFELNRLNIEIKQARLIDPKRISPEYVTMNSIVQVTFPETGISRKFKIVYPQCAEIRESKISILSPLGCALLGCRKGQEIIFTAGDNSRKVVIDEILFQPEANGLDLE